VRVLVKLDLVGGTAQLHVLELVIGSVAYCLNDLAKLLDIEKVYGFRNLLI
tara:strand:- start:838 stop:990 length:153 start_codon:yes stop_codon:yes gene_type:complete